MLRTRYCCLAALLALALSAPAGAAPILLQDGDSFLTLDASATNLLTSWSLGGISHLREQGYRLRVSGQPDRNVSLLDTTATTLSDADGNGLDDTLRFDFEDTASGLTLELGFSLSATPPGLATAATLLTEIEFFNPTAQALTVSLFQYGDPDLFGVAAGNVLSVGEGASLLGTESSGFVTYEQIFLTAPDDAAALLFDPLLAAATAPFPPIPGGATAAAGDVVSRVRWDLLLAPGSGASLATLQGLALAPILVPEPASVWLVLVAFAGVASNALRGLSRPFAERGGR